MLKPLNDIYTTFADQVGISQETALVEFNLAPLDTRRDMAMLALLHKVSLGIAPEPIRNLFKARSGTLDMHGFGGTFSTHCRQLHDPVAFNHPVIIKRSIFGLIRIYNRLPTYTLDAKTPKVFQHRLQNAAKDAARANSAIWQQMFHAS